MFLVVSTWEVIPGHEEEFAASGRRAREIMRAQPGVTMIEAFDSNGKKIAVHGYTDEAAYNAVVNAPDGPFAKLMEETNIEEHARWIGSERGETIDQD